MATIKITMTLPDFFDIKKLEAATVKAVNDTLDEVENDYKSSVKDFSAINTPIFTKKKATVQGNVVSGSVGTSDENYARLNFGTSGHRVPKSGYSRMSFRTGYKKKTRRGRIPSVSGGASGEWAHSTHHWVSGIDPRRYDETIAVANEPVLKLNVEKAIQSLA